MTANVRDIQALRDFRAKLIGFAGEVAAVLQSMQSDGLKTREWIEQDCPLYWNRQMQRAFDLVASTRASYQACQMRTVGGQRSSCIEEKVAYDRARRRLEHCQQQLQTVKRWSMKLQHDSDEFQGRMNGLRRLLETDIPKALAFLERSTALLESYAEIARPNSEGPSPT